MRNKLLVTGDREEPRNNAAALHLGHGMRRATLFARAVAVFALACAWALLCPLAADAAESEFSLSPLAADPTEIARDFSRIAKAAGWPETSLTLAAPDLLNDEAKSEVRIHCAEDRQGIRIQVQAPPDEWAATAYLALRKLGFLFPHPRWQISPTIGQASAHCGEVHPWQPRFRYRGFHLHTLHPNEWVNGFLEGDGAIAEDIVRWHARNQQNLIQVVLVGNISTEDLAARLRKPFELAKQLGLHTGVNMGLVQIQQMSRRLMPMFGLVFGDYFLKTRLAVLVDSIDFDFLTLDFGVTEFHDTPRASTLGWLDSARRLLEARGRRLFGKVHVSKPTADPQDNYNFLIRDSALSVGVLPHTVMFYGLTDDYTPVYGRQNFQDMRKFIVSEAKRRPTWYFPETSYWVGMDIDIPLLLTDYLLARSADMDYVEAHGVTGHLTFTSGQELGYWLFDWTVALLNDAANRGDPLIGLKLLGEDPEVWQRILQFQHEQFKLGQLIQELSSANMLDELPPPIHQSVHKRNTLADLYMHPDELQREITQLAQARSAAPALDKVKNEELRLLLEVTWARIDHAYWLRRAMSGGFNRGEAELASARQTRMQALAKMQAIAAGFNRYPEAHIFEVRCTPTSYAFGSNWPSVSLHFWEREESMVGLGRRFPAIYFDPLYHNIWNPFAIVLDLPSPRCLM